VVSYTTVSPLPILILAVYSLLHLLADCSGWELPTALLCGVRTFLGVFLQRGDPGDSFQSVFPTIRSMKLRLLIISSLILLSACGNADTAPTPATTPTQTITDRAVPVTCEIPDVISAFALVIPPAQYIPSEWKPAAGTDLYEAINSGGIACTYGDQDAEVGGTVIWAMNKNDLWKARTLEWEKEGMLRVEIPSIDEMDAYRLPDGATSADGMPAWKVNLLIHGVWIQLGAAFIQSWDEATPIIRAAINATRIS